MQGAEFTVEAFGTEDAAHVAAAAALLAAAFPQAYADCAAEEAAQILDSERIAVKAVSGGELIGFAGAIPQYGATGWELHPVVVDARHRGRGVGAALVREIERLCAARGAVTLYLGTDDEFRQTSLSGCDLYGDLYGRIAGIQNLRAHPYEFYQKLGYRIVGVIPDANGFGKPDIIMAKRIGGTDR